MTQAAKTVAKKVPARSANPAVEAAFGTYPEPVRTRLRALRRLIFDTASATNGVGRRERSKPPSLRGA
jgi:hypothetical protein